MRRAIQLARNGELDASTNPMVGAVIVDKHGRVIGEGWHRRCGDGHAEVNAVASVADRSLLADATIYVTLEPCAHYGKTPPCAQLIIDCGIPRVIIGSVDPFAKVAGRGIAMLREAGVEVTTGCLEKECIALNPRFLTAHSTHRPFVTLKWAESADGYIDGKISTPITSMLVHRERALHDAILVGSGTWIADHPRLDTRLYAGRSPLRVILDRRGRIKLSAGEAENTILLDCNSVGEVLSQLYERGVTSVLVEGGAGVLRSFIDSGLWDRIRIERGSTPIGGRVKAPTITGDFSVESSTVVDGNRLTVFSNNKDLTMNDFFIRPAHKDDAPYIGRAIVEAIGEEVAVNLAGESHSIDDVCDMFTSLARLDDTQYSYLNTLVAVDSRSDEVVGVCVGYDGAKLHELRLKFIEAAAVMLDKTFDRLEDECTSDEFYIDTLAVAPHRRGRGVASALLRATIERARRCGKPAGLLVDRDNDRARRLYERMGFVKVGERPFVHVVMDHLYHQENE